MAGPSQIRSGYVSLKMRQPVVDINNRIILCIATGGLEHPPIHLHISVLYSINSFFAYVDLNILLKKYFLESLIFFCLIKN